MIKNENLSKTTPLNELKKSILTCLLWEDTFYENGIDISKRISNLVPKVDPKDCYDLALQTRNDMKLRIAPLYIARAMANLPKHKELVGKLLPLIIQRADELTKFVEIYWKNGKCPLSSQVKKGLARAFTNFKEYDLAKYNRESSVKLKDVLFLCHAKPLNQEQDQLWKRLINDQLVVPDTWEVALSAGADKNETFTRLINTKKLGAIALLKNLRNIIQSGVDNTIVKNYIASMPLDRVLPFRFISASKYAPIFEKDLEECMFKSTKDLPKIKGKTIILVDVSFSMKDPISEKSEVTRLDTALGLAMLFKEVCEDTSVYSFSDKVVRVQDSRGFDLKTNIDKSQAHRNTMLNSALKTVNTEEHDRIIVITDEQSTEHVTYKPSKMSYIINIAPYEKGITYKDFLHINGFSEAVISYISLFEEEII